MTVIVFKLKKTNPFCNARVIFNGEMARHYMLAAKYCASS